MQIVSKKRKTSLGGLTEMGITFEKQKLSVIIFPTLYDKVNRTMKRLENQERVVCVICDNILKMKFYAKYFSIMICEDNI